MTDKGTLVQFPPGRIVYCQCGRASAFEVPPMMLTSLRCPYCPPQVGDSARRAIHKFGAALERLAE